MECELCNKKFDEKYYYKRHIDSLKACISTNKVLEIYNENKLLKEKLKGNINTETNHQGDINGSTNVLANKTTQGDHNVIGNNSGNNSGNTINIVINNYNTPNFDGIEDKFFNNLLTTWDQLIYEKFKLIYINEDKPENQSIYAPSRDRNRIKVKSDGEIKVSSLNDVLENIEDMIIEKCEHAIVDSNKTKQEKDTLFYIIDNKYLDIQRSREYYKEISNDAYLELKRTRNKMIQKIRKHLYDKKESLEIRKQEVKK